MRTHSKHFYFFCCTEFWERFGFYASRSMLILYFTKIFLFSNQTAYSLFAAFSSLLYLSPLLGGYLADKVLGTNSSVFLGGLLSTLGYFLLIFPGINFLYSGLTFIIIGNGFFIPNLPNAVGNLYEHTDARRESAFSLFYTAINIGAFFPPLLCSKIIDQFGWHAIFLLSALSLFVGTIIFFFSTSMYKQFSFNKFRLILLFLGLFCSSIIIKLLLMKPHVINFVLFSVGAFFIIYIIKKSFFYFLHERNRLLMGLLLIAFSIFFWILAEQAVLSLTIFTEYNVKRHLGNWTIPTIMFQALNPLTIIILGPLLAKLWIVLDSYNLNPSAATKFALGTICMGIGFAILPAAISFSSDGQIYFYWIVLSYVFQSIGELFVSPVGLSMITEVSPKDMSGLMIGVWYFATAVANSLAGIVASFTSQTANINSPVFTAPFFSHVFGVLGILAIMLGLLIILFVPLISHKLKYYPRNGFGREC